MADSISGSIGGQKDREWKNHKYTSRHRNSEGKWVYDTDLPEEPMEEESTNNGSSSISGSISSKNNDEGEMGVENIDVKVGNTISKGANWISDSTSSAKTNKVSSLKSNDNTEMGEEYISYVLKRK